MAESILVLGAGPAAALATFRLAQSNLPVRAIPGPGESDEDSGIERLGPLPSPDPVLDRVACRRIRVYRHCLAGTGPAVSFEFRGGPGGGEHRLLHRREVSQAYWDAARARGARVDEARAPIEIRQSDQASMEIRVGSELLRPPIAFVSDPRLLPRSVPRTRVPARMWQAEFALAPDRIEARFGIDRGEGAILDATLPSPTPGVGLGGFLRTGPVGVAAGVILRSRGPPPTEAEARAAGARWIEHPLLAPLLVGTTRVGESLTALPPGSPTPPWSGGCLRIGRAAGLLATNGLEPRGLGAELASAELATSLLQRRGASTTPPSRSMWNSAWRSYRAIQQLALWSRRSDRFKWGVGLGDTLPRFVTESAHELMTETGAPKRRVGATVRSVARTGRYPPLRLLRSAAAWMEAL